MAGLLWEDKLFSKKGRLKTLQAKIVLENYDKPLRSINMKIRNERSPPFKDIMK